MTKNIRQKINLDITGLSVQVIAALIAAAIMIPVVMYAYGYNLASLEQLFDFSATAILIKTLLGAAMLIMVFFARPRAEYLRVTIGAIGSIVLSYAMLGAITDTLALGDCLIYLVGTFIAITETLEARLPERQIQPASELHRTPDVKV